MHQICIPDTAHRCVRGDAEPPKFRGSSSIRWRKTIALPPAPPLATAYGFVSMALKTRIGFEVLRPLATKFLGRFVSPRLLTQLVRPALCRFLHARDELGTAGAL
jgi:hypothetical protein